MKNLTNFTLSFALFVFLCLFACKNKTATEITKVATYQSATVYAASTDYYFKGKDGKMIEFRVSNLPGKNEIELPSNLLESDVSEGPPGANPDLVGKEFKLIYDNKEELVRVAAI